MNHYVRLGLLGTLGALAACVPAEPQPVYVAQPPPQPYQPPPQEPYQPPPQPTPPPPQPTPPPPTAPAFDARGWTLLGSTVVDGRRDRDRIPVSRYSGRIDQLTLVVYDSDLALEDFTIEFGNRTRWQPRIRHDFREGSRSRAIDLPGDDRIIRHIDLQYRNLPGGGRARVEVYGRDTGRRPSTPPPPPSGPVFDQRGWTLLGTTVVDGRRDRDRVMVTKYAGRFDQLTMVVHDSDLDLEDFVVWFGNKTQWSPRVRHVFREGTRTRVIDLPGDDRVIQRIELQYRNLPGGGKARVEIFGRDTGRRPTPPPPPAPGPVFDQRGWTLLGTTSVTGRRDRDHIMVTKYAGRFDQLTMVVMDSDLDLEDFVVVFGNKERWSPRVRHTFREGTRTRVIDLPGDDRVIQRIELQYRNLPGGGRARVEIYGRDTGRARPGGPGPRPSQPPPPPPPGGGDIDVSGYKLIGAATVDGKRDADVVQIPKGKPYQSLVLRAVGSDLELVDITVVFGNNERFSPGTRMVFREGTRSRQIDLPGKKRQIRQIELRYANLPGGGKATLEIFAR